jgi:spore coat protein A
MFTLVLIFGLMCGAVVAPVMAADDATLAPELIPKYTSSLVIPPVMPLTPVKAKSKTIKNADYYEIAVKQFQQQILPNGFPATTVWGYGSATQPGTFNYPSFTIEAVADKPVRVKWINGLVDANGNYLPHLLPVMIPIHI